MKRIYKHYSVADPDLELRGGGGGSLDLLAMGTILLSVISSFLPKIRGGPPLDPPLLFAFNGLYQAHAGRLSKMIYLFSCDSWCTKGQQDVWGRSLKCPGLKGCVSFAHLTPSPCSIFFAFARSFFPFECLFGNVCHAG